MRFSNFFIPTLKNVSSDVKLKSHSLMLKSGMIRQEAAGIYSWLPLGYRVLKKIIKIVEDEHEKNDINQILMPTIQSSEIWKMSGRYDSYGKEMLRIKDRHSKDLLYGPTNEEMMTAIGKQYFKSYKDLPRTFYHIQNKFRDEIRPRFGVMRAREFLMKDAYSFDIDEKSSEINYQIFFQLYIEIFKKMGLPIIPVRAPSGEIGGNLSHEFHLIVESGESEIHIDEEIRGEDFKDFKISDILKLRSYTNEYYSSIGSPKGLKKFKSIKLGHIFLFGTKYSKSFDLKIDTSNGKVIPFMGSYGIGISRIPAAIIEYFNDKSGILWPELISPFNFLILNLMSDNQKILECCSKIYKTLKENKLDVLYDDRDERPGIKFSDADLIGIPNVIVVGKKIFGRRKSNN